MRRLLSVVLLAVGCSSTQTPAVIVVKARDLGALEQSAMIRGRDGGYSGLFRGRSVWIYGDTVLASKGADGTAWRHNTWSMTADLDASDGVVGFSERVDQQGAPTEFFPQTPFEQQFNDVHSEVLHGEQCQKPCGARWALWPGALVEDRRNDRALIVFTKIYAEPGEWSFHGVGTGIATWAGLDQPVKRHTISPDTKHPTLLFHSEEKKEPEFGSAAVIDGEHLYLFGCHGKDKACRLARAPLDKVLQRAAWRFYSGGDRWEVNIHAATSLFTAMDMTSVHRNEALGLWVACYSPPFANRVELRVAKQLTGPWSAAIKAFDTKKPTDGKPDHFAYSGLAHSEYTRGRFEYISYYRATAAWQGEIQLVEVELKLR